MSFAGDLKILYHLLLSPIRGQTHAARLESFYKHQAGDYDDFRKRLLRGRQELWDQMEVPQDGVWVDMGGGTGSNAEYFGDRLGRLKKLYIVDLSASLLEVARKRIADRGWTNVEAVEADATVWMPPEPVDVVTFSYSLTMIPDWFAAMDRAEAMLRPGGRIGVVDFFVSRKYASEGRVQHGWSTRSFWTLWFGSDNVYLSPDHLPYLQQKFAAEHIGEFRAKVPYIPFGRVPYYHFIGKKRDGNGAV